MIKHYGKTYKKKGTQKRAYTTAICPACGTHFEALLDNVKRGNTTTCRCNAEVHEFTNTPTYKSWQGLKYRCDVKHCKAFDRYGGRGISYDPRWSKFSAFFDDMGERPKGTSIERLDNDGDYCKENCTWATYRQQANNRRTSLIVGYKGEEMTLAELARHKKKNYKSLWWFYRGQGLPLETSIQKASKL